MSLSKSVLIVLATAAALAWPLRASAQTPTIAGELLKDWQAQKETATSPRPVLKKTLPFVCGAAVNQIPDLP